MKLIEADEAFRVLSDYYHHRTETQAAALREALDRVPEAVVNEKEYIVRETSYPLATKQEVIGELVRCKDCRHWRDDNPRANGYHCCYRMHNIFPMKESDFCSRGERRTDETD